MGLGVSSKERTVTSFREVRGGDKRIGVGLTESQYIRRLLNEERFYTAEVGSNAMDVRK